MCVETVAATDRAIGAENLIASESEIAHRVQHLVTHELVRVTQAFIVENAVVADGNGVVQRGTQGKPRLPKLLDIAHETEGAGPRKLVAVRTRRHVEAKTLTSDQRRVEIDLDVEMEARMGSKLAPALTFLDADGLQHLDVAPALAELAQAGLVDCVHEGSRAA